MQLDLTVTFAKLSGPYVPRNPRQWGGIYPCNAASIYQYISFVVLAGGRKNRREQKGALQSSHPRDFVIFDFTNIRDITNTVLVVEQTT